MRRLLLAACLILPVPGCAQRGRAPKADGALKPQVPALANATIASAGTVTEANDEPAVVAPILVFNLPEAKFGPPLTLSRSVRQPEAFLGFDEGVAEAFFVGIDDRQRENVNYDRYERRAVSVRTGVRYR